MGAQRRASIKQCLSPNSEALLLGLVVSSELSTDICCDVP